MTADTVIVYDDVTMGLIVMGLVGIGAFFTIRSFLKRKRPHAKETDTRAAIIMGGVIVLLLLAAVIIQKL